MTEPAITLYRLQACPFCERVVRKLDEYDLDYQSRFVEPLHSRRNVVKRISGVRTVPVLVDEQTGVTMAESAEIVEYLEATDGPDGPLTEARIERTASAGGQEGAWSSTSSTSARQSTRPRASTPRSSSAHSSPTSTGRTLHCRR